MDRTAHLTSLLRSYRCSDEAERSYRERMLALAEVGPTGFARERYQPGHFTASAFVIDSAGDALLLILHGKLGLWLQPGGHVDPDDRDILAAARRELVEEVNLEAVSLLSDGIFDIDIHQIPAGKVPMHEHFDVRFLFRAEHDAVRAGSDAKDARWVPLQEVGAMHSDASVTRAVAKLRSRGVD
jgi:8-oxo-dGTP pyrophosphatase MutT (NUDIX family)